MSTPGCGTLLGWTSATRDVPGELRAKVIPGCPLGCISLDHIADYPE